MDTYFKCSCCGQFELMHKAHFLSCEDEEKDINAVCFGCFANSQDAIAFNESDGIFQSFEDWMQDKGATIADTTNERFCREY